jgi:hypothetical protein
VRKQETVSRRDRDTHHIPLLEVQCSAGDKVVKYSPMNEAPKSRSIIAKHRDGREIMVKWDKRSGPPRNSFSGNRDPGMVEGWCDRDSVYVFFPSDLTGWRECDEE